ncbi:hypothetical protein D3C86_1110180 [compost metagenome]
MQHQGIRHHQRGLMERPDEVLAARMVDGDLAPHRGVDLGEQRRRHLHEGHPALVGGRHEPRQVPDHSATQGDHGALALQAPLDGQIVEAFGLLQGLGPLGIGHHPEDRRPARVLERALRRLAVEALHCRVGHHQARAGLEDLRHALAERRQGIGRDRNVVGTRTERHPHLGRGAEAARKNGVGRQARMTERGRDADGEGRVARLSLAIAPHEALALQGERPIRLLDPAPQLLGGRMQDHHGAGSRHQAYIVGIEHRPAAGGDHLALAGADPGEDLLLA